MVSSKTVLLVPIGLGAPAVNSSWQIAGTHTGARDAWRINGGLSTKGVLGSTVSSASLKSPKKISRTQFRLIGAHEEAFLAPPWPSMFALR